MLSIVPRLSDSRRDPARSAQSLVAGSSSIDVIGRPDQSPGTQMWRRIRCGWTMVPWMAASVSSSGLFVVIDPSPLPARPTDPGWIVIHYSKSRFVLVTPGAPPPVCEMRHPVAQRSLIPGLDGPIQTLAAFARLTNVAMIEFVA